MKPNLINIKTAEVIFANQEKGGNLLYERIAVEGIMWTLLTACMQSGKTGAAIHLCEKLYEDGFKFLFFGPSDNALKNQTLERLRKHPKVSMNLLGSKVWHAADIYSRGVAYEELCRHIGDAKKLGLKVLVIFDEAHIGIGAKSREDMQKIPEFLRDICECLPGSEGADKNMHMLLVSATPFTYDVFQNKWGEFSEVYLENGENYIGLKELMMDGRLLPHIRRSIPAHIKGKERTKYKKAQDRVFVKRLSALISTYAPRGYFVTRCTVSSEEKLFRDACTMAGVTLRVFESKNSNILEFEKTLWEPPTEPTVLLVKRSYKQGKTLCLDNIAAWYENDTRSGRHDADMAQSVGRVLGYHKDKNHEFPIFCDVESIESMAEYYEACARGDFDSKRQKPHSSTHTKHKITMVPLRQTHWALSEEAAIESYKNLMPNHTDMKPNRSTVSKINSYDALDALIKSNIRQSTNERVNFYYVDKPSKHPSSAETFVSNPHRIFKWGFVVDTEQEEMQVKTTDKSFLSHLEVSSG